jgi:hypothetical protein
MKFRLTVAHLFERFTKMVKRFAFSVKAELRKCRHWTNLNAHEVRSVDSHW